MARDSVQRAITPVAITIFVQVARTEQRKQMKIYRRLPRIHVSAEQAARRHVGKQE